MKLAIREIFTIAFNIIREKFPKSGRFSNLFIRTWKEWFDFQATFCRIRKSWQLCKAQGKLGKFCITNIYDRCDQNSSYGLNGFFLAPEQTLLTKWGDRQHWDGARAQGWSAGTLTRRSQDLIPHFSQFVFVQPKSNSNLPSASLEVLFT